MKAKLTIDWDVVRYSNQTALAKGTEVSIVPHMEADAEDVLNRHEGMCYLCKLDNGTCEYIPAVYLEITDCDNIDWEQRRYEIAKGLYCSFPEMNADRCVVCADNLIEELKKHS